MDINPQSSNSQSSTAYDKFSLFCITLLIFSALISITSRTIADADLWGHLRFGLDNIQARSIAQVDPYSYLTTGVRWINHEWLSEVVFAIFWQIGHSPGLIILKTIVGVICLGIIFWYLISLNITPIRAGALTILGWFGLLTAIVTVRPHIFTLLFSTILFVIIVKAETGKYKWLWATPIVLLLWINFHGGVLAGLGFLGIWTIVHLVFNLREWKHIIPPVAVSTLAILVNPYGLDLVVFLLRTATVPRPEILEWQPLDLVSLLGAIYVAFLIIAILGLGFSKLKKSIPLIVLLTVAALLPFIAFRHLPLFALAVLVFGGRYIGDAWSQFRPQKRDNKPPLWIAVISIITSIILIIWSIPNFKRITIPTQPESFFPDRAVSLIAESKVTGNLAVEFNWGQYVLWHIGPDIKVSMDGRRETVYPEEIYEQHLDFVSGLRNWDKLLDEFETNLALVYRSGAASNLLEIKDGWELIYQDGTSSLFASNKWPEIEMLKKTAAESPNLPVNDTFP